MKSKLILAALAVVALLAAFWLGSFATASRGADTAPAPSAPLSPASTVATGTDKGAAEMTARTAAIAPNSMVNTNPASAIAQVAPASIPLPPLDAPLASTIASLRQRAAKGDARAACRLAAELRKCEIVDVQLAFAERLEKERSVRQQFGNDAASKPERGRRDIGEFADRQYETALSAVEHCKNVPQTPPSEQIRYWRQAALSGHVPSMRLYATGNAFRMRNSLAHLKDLEVYRHEAEHLARAAAFAGDNEALLALANAYSPQHDQYQSSLLSQATGPDPVEELAMLLLAEKRGLSLRPPPGRTRTFSFSGGTLLKAIASARERIDPEKIRQAEAIAAERDSRFPASNPAPKPEDTHPASSFEFDGTTDLCDSESFTPVAPAPASG